MADTPASNDTSALPTRAAKLNTSAPETNAALNSPSPEKKSQAVEHAKSVEAPEFDPVAANMAEPAVEGTAKQRHGADGHRGGVESFKAPELLHGRPLGPNEQRVLEAPTMPLDGAPLPQGKNIGNTGRGLGSPQTSASSLQKAAGGAAVKPRLADYSWRAMSKRALDEIKNFLGGRTSTPLVTPLRFPLGKGVAVTGGDASKPAYEGKVDVALDPPIPEAPMPRKPRGGAA